MTSVRTLATGLAGTFLAGAWNETGLLRRAQAALDLRTDLTDAENYALSAAIDARRRELAALARRERVNAARAAYRAEHNRLIRIYQADVADEQIRAALQNVEDDDQEQRRLEREQLDLDKTTDAVALFVAGDIAAWLRPLVRRTIAAYHRAPTDRPRELAAWLAAQPDLTSHARLLTVSRRRTTPLAMAPARWPVRQLADVGALASWLRLDAGELAAFADVQSRNRLADSKLRHYRVTTRVSAGGSVRVLEAPRERLKTLQRLILRDILGAIPVHDAAHGFVLGRSAFTAARRHVAHPLVVLCDLESFFASVTAGRVYGIFRTAGYAEPVAHLLTGLCTTSLAAADWTATPPGRDQAAHWRLGRRLAAAHLPQGAPTSPALANLAVWTLDLRLAGLAESWEINYTRYADDLAFSGPAFRGSAPALVRTVRDIVGEEGFTLNAAKTRTRSQSQRQQMLGVVVNAHPAVSREALDELKAVLHNCLRTGPAAQNRAGVPDFRAHLAGRISWVTQVHPTRGARLEEQFNRIDWA